MSFSLGLRRLSSQAKALDHVVMLALFGSGAAYIPLAVQFFPAANGNIGHDYEYFLPLILAGKYWIARNGLFAVPYFSPAFCGGLPFLANPQSIFYSLPQLLSLFLDTVKAFLVTTIISAWIGGLGTYLLMRQRFAASVPAAALGATVFMFNSFLLHRMAVGHVTYYVVALVPLLCHLLLAPLESEAGRRRAITRGCGVVAASGSILAYLVYAGAVNVAVPVALTVAAVWLLHSLLRPQARAFWVLAPAAALLGGAVGAAKLAPAMAFVAHFPRPGALQLYPNAAEMLGTLFKSLFLPWLIPNFPGKHEFDYGVGVVPLIAIGLGICTALARGHCRRLPKPITLLKLAALALILAIPLRVNYGGPEFAAWLKSLPYVGENVILLRWFLVYLLPLSLIAGLVVDYRVSRPNLRCLLSLAGMAVTVLISFATDQSYYLQQPYNPRPVLAAGGELAGTGYVPPIKGIGGDGRPRRNDALVSGLSALPCYEPIFGYELESFPGRLTAGSPLRDPACYIYGVTNHCAPGGAFASPADAAMFAAYRPFPFVLPQWQADANRLTLGGIGLAILGFMLAFCSRAFESICRSAAFGSGRRSAS
jgi:hypothetical protein